MIKKETSAGVLVYRNDPKTDERLYLLLHYVSGHWDFAKGKLEKGESFKQAALRELQEETGLTSVVLHEHFNEKLDYAFTHVDRDQRIKIEKQVVFFVGRETTGTADIQVSAEHIGYAWLSYHDAFNRLTYNNAKQILQFAREFVDMVERS